MAQKAYIALGSNVEDRLVYLKSALEHLFRIGCEIAGVSSVYETEPVECYGGWFLNAVVSVHYNGSADDLLCELKSIEDAIGKNKQNDEFEKHAVCKGDKPDQPQNPKQWSYKKARCIDLDLIFFGSQCVDNEQLVLPHLRIQERRFVLAPICDLDPSFVHPVLGVAVRDLFLQLTDSHIVIKTALKLTGK
ncbi:MAG: 2-amino-4-hydroxy-6-hydroxymethyldihydropteridine diphosphokinase [Chlamydiota bacterium]|nr:2-amino-4-hydroxy-6-hydroxymethyldihydropteridine diphosphokinase [Chlamydiota bacterium]